MYFLRLLDSRKINNSNIYIVKELRSNSVYKVKTDEMECFLYRGWVTNAVWQSKIVPVYDVQRAITELACALGNSRVVYAKVTHTINDFHEYLKFYNSQGQDITVLFWRALQRYYKITDKGELSVSGIGGDKIFWVLIKINDEAGKLGVFNGIVNLNYIFI